MIKLLCKQTVIGRSESRWWKYSLPNCAAPIWQLSREMFSVKAQKLASELFVHQKSTKPRIQSEVLLVIKTEAVHCTSGQLYILKESYNWVKTKTIGRCAGKKIPIANLFCLLAKNCFGPEESIIVGLLKNLRLTRNKETCVSWQSYKYLNWILTFLVWSTRATKQNICYMLRGGWRDNLCNVLKKTLKS